MLAKEVDIPGRGIKGRMAKKKERPAGFPSAAEALELQRGGSQDIEAFIEQMDIPEGDPTVKLPEEHIDGRGGRHRFESGSNPVGERIGANRLAIRKAIVANPQLFVELLHRMTPQQRQFMVILSDNPSLELAVKDMAKASPEKTAEQWYNWYGSDVSVPPVIKEAMWYGSRAIHQNAINMAIQLRNSYLAKAVLVKASGLDSEDEKIRQAVASEIIEWALGKAGVRITTETDTKYDALMERIASAAEKAAGVAKEIEGEVIDVTPQGLPEG
jgi:hypothetical protein